MITFDNLNLVSYKGNMLGKKNNKNWGRNSIHKKVMITCVIAISIFIVTATSIPIIINFLLLSMHTQQQGQFPISSFSLLLLLSPYTLPVFATEEEPLANVTNLAEHTLSVIDTNTNKVVDMIALDNEPAGIAFDAVHNRMYVSHPRVSTVSVIDTNTNAVTDTIAPVGIWPSDIAFDPVHDRMYVADRSIGDPSQSSTVNVIDTNTNKVVDMITVGNDAAGIAFDAVHNRMYVSVKEESTVYVIDTNTNKVVDMIICCTSPSAIAFDSEHEKMYLINLDDGLVYVIDTNTNKVVSIIGSPTFLRAGIAHDPVHKRMYTTNTFLSSVTVID